MTNEDDVVDRLIDQVRFWQDMEPPNETSRKALQELKVTIANFKSMRGNARFDDDPTTFEQALTEISTFGLKDGKDD